MNELYEEIGEAEYYRRLDISLYARESITDSEIRLLEKLKLNYRVIGEMFEVKTTPQINIYKLSDEWFIVRCYSIPFNKYYRCSQRDGLMKYIKTALSLK